MPKGISTDIEISFDTNNNNNESRLVRIIITHKVFKDAGKYWGFFWALTFMISWCLKNSKVIVCVQYANFYLRSIFFFFAILQGRVIAVLLHQKASNEDSLWTYNRSRYEFVSSHEPIRCVLREPFLDEWKITVGIICSSIATQGRA